MASLNGSRSNSPSPPDFDFDSTFPEISILIAHAEQYASGLNLIVRNHPKSSFTAKSCHYSLGSIGCAHAMELSLLEMVPRMART